MVRCRRLGKAEEFHQLLHRELALREELHDLEARPVGEPVEHLCYFVDLSLIRFFRDGEAIQGLAAHLPRGEIHAVAYLDRGLAIVFRANKYGSQGPTELECRGSAFQQEPRKLQEEILLRLGREG